MNTIIGRGFRRREVVLAWVPIGLATLPFTAAAIDPPSTTLANGARVAIVDDTLEIEGTPEDDLIQIGATRHPDTVRVTVDGEDRGHHGPIVRIEIHAGAGDDLVRVGERVELPVRINGGPGDDRLHGGSGHDLVFGEDGDDVLFASRGRDAFDGGAGSNQLRIGQPTERIWVGSATGEAARILSQAYRLVPLNTDAPATELGPIVVGIADLADEDIAEHLRTAYQAGHTIALTGAEAEHAETLRNLLGHASGAGWSEDISQTDLVAFRRAIRPDGGAHESTSILLPRVEELLPAEARLGRREADMLVVEALSQLFSGTPVLADESICTGVSPEECLQTLAESYQSQILVQNNGARLQITNSAYNARSFQNGFDLYYVFQEVAYTAVAGASTLNG
jgi:Ca2+-binding RTX toxin-like protein